MAFKDFFAKQAANTAVGIQKAVAGMNVVVRGFLWSVAGSAESEQDIADTISDFERVATVTTATFVHVASGMTVWIEVCDDFVANCAFWHDGLNPFASLVTNGADGNADAGGASID